MKEKFGIMNCSILSKKLFVVTIVKMSIVIL